MKKMPVKMRLKRWLTSYASLRKCYRAIYLPIRLGLYQKTLQRKMRRLGPHIIATVHRVCTREGIPYFADYGTLLGFVREKGFIPHDNDIDFGILPPHPTPTRLIQALQAEGFQFIKAFTYEGQITELSFTYQAIQLDFFLHFPIDQRLWAHYYAISEDNQADWQHPPVIEAVRTFRPTIPTLIPYDVLGTTTMIPSNYEDVLTAHYGRGWHTPNPSWNREAEGDYCVKQQMDPTHADYTTTFATAP